MQAAVTPVDVLYVGGETDGRQLGGDGRLRVSTGTVGDEWPETEFIDCLLVDTTGASDGAVDVVRTVRGVYPDTPLVAFTEAETVEPVLDAGATDVVRSRPAETPDALLRRRVENVSETTPVAGVAEHGSYTYEDLLEQLSENLRDVIWVNNPDKPPGMEMEFVSAAYEEVWGRPREHLFTGGTEAFHETIHPEDRERVREISGRGRIEAGHSDVTYRIVRPDGEVRWIHDRALDISDEGETSQIVGISRDITERKERQRDLERGREFLEQVQEVSDVTGWEYDFRSEQVRITEATGGLFDNPAEMSLSIDQILDLHPPADRERMSDAVSRVRTEGEPFALEVRIRLDERGQRWVYTQGEPVYEDGEVVAVRGVSRDITERKQREQQLQAERDLVERILATSSLGILVHDPSREVTRANEQAAQIMDVETGTLEGCQSAPDGVRILDASGEPRSEGEIAVERAKRTGEPVRNEEVVVETPAGNRRVVVADAVPLFEDGELQRIVATLDDVTERVERENRLESQRNELARLDRINHIIRDVDMGLVSAETREEIEAAVCTQLSGSGPYETVLAFRTTGDELSLATTCQGDDVDRSALAETPISAPVRRAAETGTTQASEEPDDQWTVCDPLTGSDTHATAAIPLDSDGQTHGVLVVCSAREEPFHERELDVLDELGDTVGYAIEAVERREREATLTSLYEATQDLLAAESPQAVCDVVVETAASVLDPSGVGIFLFDDDENVLKLAAGTDQLREFYDGALAFGPGRQDSITWQTYLTGETQFFSDIHSSEKLVNPDTDGQTALFLPLGEHGVFVVASDERISFGEEKRRLVDLLGATTETALDRVAGWEGIRKRDRRLAERASRLERLEELFALVGRIDDTLRQADSPGDVERRVCEQLVDTDRFQFAWIGAIRPDGGGIEPRTWADGETSARAYLDEVSFGLDGDTPTARAATSRESVRISNVTDHLRDADWAQVAVEHDYESVLAVPLEQDDALYGVLTVYATDSNAFGAPAQTVFDRLSTLVPHVSTGLQRDRTALADRVTELELSLPDPGGFPNAVAATADETVQCRQVSTPAERQSRIVFQLADTALETVRDVGNRFVSVESLESLETLERAGATTVRATLSGPTAATRLLSCGAIPEKVLARPDSTTATVRLPHDADVRLFLDRVADHYPGVELVSRRDVSVRDDTEAAAHTALSEDLTDRQREVLRTAYEEGFFESPRATTGVELADILGVSQPTVTHHLREAQRRLFDVLLDDI